MREDRQPVFHVPKVISVSVILLAVIHIGRILLPGNWRYGTISLFGLVPGRYLPEFASEIYDFPGGLLFAAAPFLTHALLHANFPHLLINGAFLLAFGSAVARQCGAARFLLLSACCALGGAVFHLFFAQGSAVPMIGASGAVSGLMAAAFRLGALAGPAWQALNVSIIVPLHDRRLLIVCAVWLGLNAAIGLFVGQIGGQTIQIAWQAHIGGFLTGLLIVPLFARRRGWSASGDE